jgi:two-component system chemotaxis response regulator CheY
MQKKILVVDDSKAMRQVLSAILQEAGFLVDTAASAEEAQGMVTLEHKLAIIDYTLPGMNGIDLVRQVRSGSINPTLPIMMMTTESEDSRKQEARLAGATGWITKPFDEAALVHLVHQLTE